MTDLACKQAMGECARREAVALLVALGVLLSPPASTAQGRGGKSKAAGAAPAPAPAPAPARPETGWIEVPADHGAADRGAKAKPAQTIRLNPIGVLNS
jgi:hypothetical protein